MKYKPLNVCRGVLLLLLPLLFSASAAAQCLVPSAAYPSIQSAVDDGACSGITVAAGVFGESLLIQRDLSLRGAGSDATLLEGNVEITAGLLDLTGLHIAGMTDALKVHSGAEVSAFDVEVLDGQAATLLFADGFETGATDQWSGATP